MHIAFGRCIITADIAGRPSSVTWYIMYLAAIAIDAMCVRQGLVGVMNRLGESCQMTRPNEND